MAKQYIPKVNEIVYARRTDKQTSLSYNDATWYRFIVSYVDTERNYIGMESLGTCDDYEGELSLLEYKKDKNIAG